MLKSVLLLIVLCIGSAAFAGELQGRVAWVYDGDTIEVNNIGKVRLLGIDSPEYKDSPRDDFYLKKFHIPRQHLRKIAQAAKRFTITNAKGKVVRVEPGKTRYDKYGRLLAYVYLPNRQQLNTLLLQQGLATVFRRYDFAQKKSFLAIEQQAQKARVGLWNK